MANENLSLLEWIQNGWRRPLWRKLAWLAAAGILLGLGILSVFIAPDTLNFLPLIGLAAFFFILGIRIEVPDEPLPVIEDEEWASAETAPLPIVESGGETADRSSAPEALSPASPGPAAAESEPEPAEAPATTIEVREPAGAWKSDELSTLLRWVRLPLSILLALWAQALLDFRPAGISLDSIQTEGLVLYLAAAALAVWAFLSGDAAPAITGTRLTEPIRTEPRKGGRAGWSAGRAWIGENWLRPLCALTTLVLGAIAYAGFAGGMFHIGPIIAVVIALLYWLLATGDYRGTLYQLLLAAGGRMQSARRAFGGRLRKGITVSWWSLLVIAVFAGLAVYRTYNMAGIPPEMTSDHAEKLINVIDVLQGRTYIFFANNGGREPLEMYLVAAVATILGTGISFLSLKIVSVAVGLLTLPFIYLLGKELADRRVGLLAMFLTGIAYWPDMISRIGLRLPLAMLFTAVTLFFFLRALRRRRWNDFLWAGAALGIGLYGYTPIRIVPIAMGLAVLLFVLHPSSRGQRLWAIGGFAVSMVTAVILFVPFIRYAVDFPSEFWLRTVTRIVPETGGVVTQPVAVFFRNTVNALRMFSWNDGTGWFNCVPLRPALDFITGGLFHLGALWVFLQFLRRRTWEALFVILSVPVLLLPSILALAEPGSNPSLARTIAAVPVVYLLPAFGFVMAGDYLRRVMPGWAGRAFATALFGVLFLGAWAEDADLTLRQYPAVYRGNAENASELGAFIRDFTRIIGRPDDVYLVPYPYWVDDRLMNLYAGLPIDVQHVMYPDKIADAAFSGRPTLYLLLATDTDSLHALENRFPQGEWQVNPSAYGGDDYISFLVPGNPGQVSKP